MIPTAYRRDCQALTRLEKSRNRVQNALWSLTAFPWQVAVREWEENGRQGKEPGHGKFTGLGLDQALPGPSGHQAALDALRLAEAEAEEAVIGFAVTVPVVQWARDIKGLGSVKLVARLLGEIGDPYIIDADPRQDRPQSVRAWPQLQSYSGLIAVNGRAIRHAAGEQSDFKDSVKVRLWNISDQFIRQGTPVYTDLYHATRERFADQPCESCRKDHPPLGKPSAHINKLARRAAGTAFLKDLWNAAREWHEEGSITPWAEVYNL
jgi:hypothetical protein